MLKDIPDFAKRIKAVRVLKGISPYVLAEELDVTAPSIYKWERGETAPNTAALFAYCKQFNISADYLLGLHPNQELLDTVVFNRTVPPAKLHKQRLIKDPDIKAIIDLIM